jgi:hypothetical protein
VLNRLQFAAVVAAAVGLVVRPLSAWAAYSRAAEIAAASAADWFCRWIQNHIPTSMPSPANPIRIGNSTATATATTPHSSRQRRRQTRGREIAALPVVTSWEPKHLASGPGASDDCLLEKIDHAQDQGRTDHDHHRRQDKPHQRESQQDREACCTFLVAR